MADNVTADAGSGGATFRTDDDGAAHWPYTKLAWGADNTQTIVADSNGSRVPVKVSALGDSNIVATDGSAVLTLGVQAMGTDGANAQTISVDSSGNLQCDIVADGAGLATAANQITNTVSTNNSTTATMGISGVWTAAADDVSSYTSVTIQLDSSHDSATDGMTFQFSSDNTNWDDVYTFTYTAANGARRFQFPVTAQYFRNVYTNGGTGQTHFRVQTILHRNNVLTSVHRMADTVSIDRSATVVKSAILAQINGSGAFTPVASSAQGDLNVSLENDGLYNTEDNASAQADGGIPALVVRDDALSANAGVNADGDYTWLRVNNDGALWAEDVNSAAILADTANMDTNLGTVAGAVAAGQMQVDIVADGAGLATAANQLADGHNVTIDNASGGSAVNIQDGGNTITVDGTVGVSGTVTTTSVGTIADDATTPGNPVMIGGTAKNFDGTAPGDVSAEDDVTRLITDGNRRLLVNTTHPNFVDYHEDSSSALTDTSVFAAPGAGKSVFVTDIVVSTGAATAFNIFFEESTTTVLGPYYLEATAGRGMALHFTTPKQITANTALTVTTSAAIAHSIDVTGYIADVA